MNDNSAEYAEAAGSEDRSGGISDPFLFSLAVGIFAELVAVLLVGLTFWLIWPAPASEPRHQPANLPLPLNSFLGALPAHGRAA